MIQRMNNTLVKHNKVFFTILLIIIVIGFVMFFGAMDPTSFLGELMGGSRNNLGRVFDKEDVTISEINEARKKASLLFVVNPAFTNSINTDNLFYLVAFEKAARLNGVAVSDKELQEAVSQIPLFADENGKFSPAKYKEFTDTLGKNYQATATEFEEAFRMYLSIVKFQMSSANAVSVSENEVDMALRQLAVRTTYRTISFDVSKFGKDIKVEKQEIEEYYSKNKDIYLEYSALVVYFNANAVKDVKIDAKQLEEAKKSDLYKGKTDAEITAALTKNKAAETATGKVDEFRKELIKAYGKPEYNEAFIRKLAAEKGLEVMLTEGLSYSSPATSILDNKMISAICQLKNEMTFTQIMQNGDAATVAILLKKSAPSQEKLDKVIYPEISKIRLAAKVNEAALAEAKKFTDAVKDGKITVENLEAKAKEFGAVPGAENSESLLENINKQLSAFSSMFGNGNDEMMNGMIANMADQFARILIVPTPNVNSCSAPYLSRTAVNTVEALFCVKNVQLTGIEVTPFTRKVIKEAILLNKRQMAAIAFSEWLEKNIQRYMSEEEKQQQESAGE